AAFDSHEPRVRKGSPLRGLREPDVRHVPGPDQIAAAEQPCHLPATGLELCRDQTIGQNQTEAAAMIAGEAADIERARSELDLPAVQATVRDERARALLRLANQHRRAHLERLRRAPSPPRRTAQGCR